MDSPVKPVKWSSRATKDLEKITRFYIHLYGNSKARQIASEIQKSTEILENKTVISTKIGALDETFHHLKHEYRKLISSHCKITYRVGKNKVYIVRVFDTRQNPLKNN